MIHGLHDLRDLFDPLAKTKGIDRCEGSGSPLDRSLIVDTSIPIGIVSASNNYRSMGEPVDLFNYNLTKGG